ncbi:TetR family transcriptional regulator [Mangrovimicrobium sediminis]|uniref:TetR family transcriptional regulator n=1 Tax=Mangrovimicrobium sediminis TaxID=2562682 RepID=A0A4Z0M661_9GAMM|nr:TetR/AcrR family transcriptional regulator [Haliea sp. SAOS-164]TGD74795.1 TetR family transcriptional regulator [Haliea sp. SAOS-164]
MTSDLPSSVFLSPTKTRILNAALDLFCDHGVAGTSLQMIAEAVGVTKAAIYHQFPAKDDILQATGQLIFDTISSIIDHADAQPTAAGARAVMIEDLIDLAASHRRIAAFIQRDPVIVRLLEEDETLHQMFRRLNAIMLDGDYSDGAKVALGMLLTAIGCGVRHPLLRNVDDETLREHMRAAARGLEQQLGTG